MDNKTAKEILEQSDYLWLRTTTEEQEALRLAEEALENCRPKGHWDFRGDNLFRCTECGAIYTYSQLER